MQQLPCLLHVRPRRSPFSSCFLLVSSSILGVGVLGLRSPMPGQGTSPGRPYRPGSFTFFTGRCSVLLGLSNQGAPEDLLLEHETGPGEVSSSFVLFPREARITELGLVELPLDLSSTFSDVDNNERQEEDNECSENGREDDNQQMVWARVGNSINVTNGDAHDD